MIYTLHISIERSEPAIWRRFLVHDAMTLGNLHDAIQVVMGWTDSHLHRFAIDGNRYTKIYPEIPPMDPIEEIEEDNVLIGNVLKKKGQKFVYIYDYGDHWRHNLVVEAIGEAESVQQCPVCLDGAQACPPEDCGGLWGYYHLLETLADPEHEEHNYFLEWVGVDFNPERFDLKGINAALKKL